MIIFGKVGQFMISDVVLNKISVIERCVKRIHEEYDNNPDHLNDYTKQDSIVLNILRACEASIDLSMHLVAVKKLGVPQTSRKAFDILFENNIISKETTERMKAMVGFRNIAVRDYQTLNMVVVRKIVEEHLVELKRYTVEIQSHT